MPRCNLHSSIVNWKHSVSEKWGALKFGDVKVQSNDTEHNFEVEVYLDGLDTKFVRVELYADGIDDDVPIRQPMTQVALTDAKSNSVGPHWAVYRASVVTTRPASDFTARIVPDHAGVAVPLELNLISWQR